MQVTEKLSMVVAMISLGGCLTVGPEYIAPEMDVGTQFIAGGSDSIGDVSAQSWWLEFDDIILNDLVARGQAQNLDIRTAQARVADAREALEATGWASFFGGSFLISHTRSGGAGLPATMATAVETSPNLDIDLFGSNQRRRQQGLATLEASQMNLGASRQMFMTSLVSQYIQARYFQEAMAITKSMISNQKRVLGLVESQQSEGAATLLDIARARAQLDDLRASLPELESGFFQAVYAIATLLAEPAPPIVTKLSRGAPQPVPSYSTSGVGVPADLLRNRPDIRAAERNYASAVAEMGIAEASLYPSLTLSGVIISAPQNTWSFGPSLMLPLLNQPVLRSNRNRARIKAEQAELVWHHTVLYAVEQIQSGLSNLARTKRELANRRAAVISYDEVEKLTKSNFSKGAATTFEVLNAEREVANARLALAGAYRNLALDWTSLQIAAGRGWGVSSKMQ